MGQRRKLDELITLYELEPELKEVFTEGNTDKVIIEKYFRINKIEASHVKVTEIQDIDFSEVNEDTIQGSNKNKLIYLAKQFETEISENLLGVTLVIDYDFDHLTSKLNDSKYITYYDYNSLELYCWDCKVLDDYYSMILRKFKYDGEQTLINIKEPLIDLFLIRACFEIRSTTPEGGLVDFKKSIKFNKDGTLNFDYNNYLIKNLNKSKEMKNKGEYHKLIHTLRSNLHSDHRMNIRGHDFIDMLYHYIDNFKSSNTTTADELGKTIFQSLDFQNLRTTPFFNSLSAKYS